MSSAGLLKGKAAAATPRDRVRAIVRDEVARARPIEQASRSLELIVESSLRYREVDGDLTITVVDETGQVRSRPDGGDFTIADYLDELRRKHPTLFAPEEPRPADAPQQGERAAADAQPAASHPAAAAEPQRRDWLDLGAAPSAAQPAAPESSGEAPSSTPTATPGQGWRARLAPAMHAGASAARSVGLRALESIGRSGRAWRMRRRRDVVADAAAPALGPSPIPVGTQKRLLPILGAAAAFVALLVGAALVIPRLMDPAGSQTQVAAAPTTPRPAEPATTGAVSPPARPSAGAPPAADPPPATGTLRGVPEVIDTSTLRLEDRIVRLFGVEWARGGGDPDDLARYLRSRPVTCEPAGAPEIYRCQVEGQDLSRVVLFNGGGRTTPDATPDLRAAEDHARASRIGVWAKESRTPTP